MERAAWLAALAAPEAEALEETLLPEVVVLRRTAELAEEPEEAALPLEVVVLRRTCWLAEDELAQCKIIERYLPAMLSEEELTAALKEIIAQVGATGPQDMGKVMGVATKQLAGKAEGKAINLKVRELLAQ